MSKRAAWAGLAAAAWLAVAAGCAASGPPAAERDPGSVVNDPAMSAGKRGAAVREGWRQAGAGEIDRSLWREAMKKTAWSASTPAAVRIPAIEGLLEDDEADTRNMLRLMLPREPARAVVEQVSAWAGERGWTEMTPALVRRWAVAQATMSDEERPERRALEALHPGRPVEDVVFEVFATPGDGSDLSERARKDAWALLCRLDRDRSRTRALLTGSAGKMGDEVALPALTSGGGRANPDDPMLAALRAGAAELRAVPSTGEQLEWLLALREPGREAFWREASASIAGLSEPQLVGFELRHAAGVRWAAARRPEWLRASREELLGELSSRLEGRKRYKRIAEIQDGVAPPREDLEANRDRLSWGDALLALIADEALRDPGVRAALREQMETDRLDKSTEHGGVLDASGEGFVATPFAPRPAQRMADNRFVASPELLEAGHTALFHYHFHARKNNEREYAGPGPGDEDYADRFGRSCLVFTSLERDAMNADYFQPGGAVIDLGEIRSGGAGR